MCKRILTYSIIGVLALTLIGGTIAILTRPRDVIAYGGQRGINQKSAGHLEGDQTQGAGRNAGNNVGGSGAGQGMGNGGQSGSGLGSGKAGYASSGQGQGSGNDGTPINWETITGVVLVSGTELTVDTGSGEFVVGLGQSRYGEDQGFIVNVGDEVRIEGYEENGEFKASLVENLTTGTSLVLRDTAGRPMWSGQNTSNNGSGQSGDVRGGYGGNAGNNGRGQGLGQGGVVETVTLPEAGGEALACPICGVVENYAGPLSEDEVNALYLALNDEYHAWAVYDQVIADFGSVRPFTSIQNAEANHISALVHLFEIYDLPVPENPWIGHVDGYEDLTSACAAGVQAEIANGGLYDILLASTIRDDILGVYTALQRASLEQHLPAFSRCAD